MFQQVAGSFSGCAHSIAKMTHVFTAKYNALGMRTLMEILLWELDEGAIYVMELWACAVLKRERLKEGDFIPVGV